MGIEGKDILRAYMKAYKITLGDLERYMGVKKEKIRQWILKNRISGVVKAIEEITGENMSIFEERDRKVGVKMGKWD